MPQKISSPQARSRLGLALLAEGHYAEGFPLLNAWRDIPGWRDKAAPQVPIQQWQGEPLDGKRVLIWSEEGFGDQIMYARFAPLLAEQAASVVWVVPHELARLFGACLPGIEIVPINTGPVPGVVDYIIPSSALPVILMADRSEPPPAPYLSAPPPNVIPGLNVGVMAKGNPAHQNDANRSLPDDLAAELLALPGGVSLAPEETGARDFHDTATIVAGLDLVISVDTSVVHLAGAMGKAVWVLLPHKADWRWQRGRADSPWYGSARLFRQPNPGDWRSVLDEVAASLR